jgi:hypothetical protein
MTIKWILKILSKNVKGANEKAIYRKSLTPGTTFHFYKQLKPQKVVEKD